LRSHDIEKSSHVNVYQRLLYNIPELPGGQVPQGDAQPYSGGPLDPRLGTSEKSQMCESCNRNMTDCPGHFGNLKLALPVFHVGYFKHTVAILQVVCKECARVLLNQEEYDKMMKRVKQNGEPSINLKLLKATIDECKKMRTCIHCGAYNGKVKKKPNEALKVLHDKFNVTKDADVDDLIN
jgi:DNA-directed RNA polymerase III subunit RPC1